MVRKIFAAEKSAVNVQCKLSTWKEIKERRFDILSKHMF